jgi:hypothetical protein
VSGDPNMDLQEKGDSYGNGKDWSLITIQINY